MATFSLPSFLGTMLHMVYMNITLVMMSMLLWGTKEETVPTGWPRTLEMSSSLLYVEGH